MHKSRAPEVLWCYCLEYVAAVRSLTSRPSLSDRTPYESLTGETPDISEYIEFDFHGWVKYWDPHASQPGEQLGKWLGVARNQGPAMVYWILKDNGYVISRSTVRPLTQEEWLDENEKKAREEFDKEEYATLGNFDESLIHDEPNDEMEEPIQDQDDDDKSESNDDRVYGPDELHGAQLYLPHGDRTEIAKIIGRKRNLDGNFVGRKHSNPMLDSRIYVVEFPDGEQHDISFNTLAEHLYAQVDEEGNLTQLFKGIIGHRRTSKAVDKADQFRIVNGRRVKKKTTSGWDIEIEWMDGTTSWIPLKDVKATNSVELAEYVVKN